MHTSYMSETPAELKLLSVCTSAAGMLCLSLSDLLPWGVFLGLAAVHAAVWYRWFDREILGTGTVLGLLGAVLAFESWQIVLLRGDAVVPALRDLIVALAMTRLLMRKTPREMYQIVGIAVAQCMLGTIFTISPLFLIGFCLMIFLVPVTLHALDAHSFSTRATPQHKGPVHWASVCAGIALTAGMLFYILPRPASSLIRHSLVQQNRFSFTEEVDLTSRGRTTPHSTIVMRILWSTGRPPAVLYLAGARLEGVSPDGFFKEERRGSVAPVSNRVTDRLTVYPTALRSENVFYPYWFHDVAPRLCLFRGTNLYWVIEPPPRYDLWVSRVPGPSAPGSTVLPDGLSGVAELGLRIAGTGDARTRVERIAAHVRSQYAYTLDAQEVPRGRSGIEWFVFSGRKGTCEHFASALAAMIRGCGIPARVVTGFLVTEYNETGSYYIVRASDAHAWVEYWDGTWHTIDATPGGRSLPALRFHLLDELRFRWIRWVIEYSLNDQITLAVRVFSVAPRTSRAMERAASHALAIVAACATLLVMASLIRNLFLPPYEKVRRAFARTGIVLDRSRPHEDHLAVVNEVDPLLAAAFRAYLEDYLAWRFGGGTADMKERTRTMVRAVRESQRRRQRRAGSSLS